MDLMLVHEATKRTNFCFLSSELKGNVDYTFPVDRITGCIGCRLETSGLNGMNCGVAKAVAKVASDPENLDDTGGRDAKTNRDGAFDMKLDGLRGVLWTGFKQNFGAGTYSG